MSMVITPLIVAPSIDDLGAWSSSIDALPWPLDSPVWDACGVYELTGGELMESIDDCSGACESNAMPIAADAHSASRMDGVCIWRGDPEAAGQSDDAYDGICVWHGDAPASMANGVAFGAHCIWYGDPAAAAHTVDGMFTLTIKTIERATLDGLDRVGDLDSLPASLDDLDNAGLYAIEGIGRAESSGSLYGTQESTDGITGDTVLFSGELGGYVKPVGISEAWRLVPRLPDSISGDMQVHAAAVALERQLQDIHAQTDIPAILYRISSMSSAQMDHLAAHFDVDGWNNTWSLARKHRIFAASYANKRRMGTLSAVRDAIDAFGAAARITEWWQMDPQGTPHTFKVEINFSAAESLPTSELQAQVRALINAAKPARSQYEMIVIENFISDATTAGKSSAITAPPVTVMIDTFGG